MFITSSESRSSVRHVDINVRIWRREDLILLVYYAVPTGLTFLSIVTFLSSRWSRQQPLDYLALQMKSLGSFETSRQGNVLEILNLCKYRCEDLKPRVAKTSLLHLANYLLESLSLPACIFLIHKHIATKETSNWFSLLNFIFYKILWSYINFYLYRTIVYDCVMCSYICLCLRIYDVVHLARYWTVRKMFRTVLIKKNATHTHMGPIFVETYVPNTVMSLTRFLSWFSKKSSNWIWEYQSLVVNCALLHFPCNILPFILSCNQHFL